MTSRPTRMLTRSLIAAVGLAGSGMAVAACGPETTVSPSVDYRLTFSVCGATLVGTITAQGTGWVAVGFSPNQYMPETDVFMAGVTADGTPYGSDRFAYFRAPPVVDGQQNVTLLGASEANGVTTVSFSRPLASSDPMDYDLTVGSYYILSAFHVSSDSLTTRHTYADASDIAYVFAPVPEPSAAILLAAGLGLLAARRRSAVQP